VKQLNDGDLEQLLLELIPANGRTKGNKALQSDLKNIGFPVERYWEIRERLIQRGLLAIGRGMGGSVYRLDITAQPPQKNQGRSEWIPEQKLYEPFANYIRTIWMKENSIDLRDCAIQITANQGRRATGGKWTRPDLAVVAVKTYTYLPGRFLQVITFELKPAGFLDVAWVYEAAAHSRYAHKTYLCVHLPQGYDKDDVNLRRLEEECARFRLGLMYFKNPKDHGTYETLIEPVGQNPPPEQVDEFIRTQLDDHNKEQILKLK